MFMATVFVKIFKENFLLKKVTYCTVVVVTFQRERVKALFFSNQSYHDFCFGFSFQLTKTKSWGFRLKFSRCAVLNESYFLLRIMNKLHRVHYPSLDKI